MPRTVRRRLAPRLVGSATVAVLGVGALAGCTAPAPDPPSPPSATRLPGGHSSSASGSTAPSPEASSPTEPETPAHADAVADLIRAGRTAEQAVDEGTVIAIETDDHGWEVDLADESGVEQQVVISADGRTVVKGPEPDDDQEDRAKNRARLEGAELDYADAAERAAREVPGGTITELELDNHRSASGQVVWDCELRAADGKHEVTLDAGDGTVLVHEKDD